MYNLKGNLVLKNRTNYKEGQVDIPDQLLKENKDGFLLSIHNHPSGNPTPSIEDIETTINHKIKYSVINGRHRGFFIIKHEIISIIDEKTLKSCLNNIMDKQEELYNYYKEYKIYVYKNYKRRKYSYIEYLDKVNTKFDLEFKKNTKEMVKFINKEFKNNDMDIKIFYLR